MISRLGIPFCLVMMSICSSVVSLAAQKPVAWAVSGMERVGKRDAPGSARSVELFAARGETEAYQIAVRGAEGSPLTNVHINVSPLTGPAGKRIANSNLLLYREHFIKVEHSTTPTWNDMRPAGTKLTVHPGPSGWYADALIPFVDPATGKSPVAAHYLAMPFKVARGETQPIWVDVCVPRDAAPGTYRGAWTVTCDQGHVYGKITLRVWDFELPLMPTLRSHFQLWNDKSVAACEVLLRHKVMPDSVPAPDAKRLIQQYGLGNISAGFFSGAGYGHRVMTPAPSIEELKAKRTQYPSELFMYNYTVDEIPGATELYLTVRQWGENLHAAGIKQLATMPPVPELFDAIDIWVLQPSYYYESPANLEKAQGLGKEIWTYTALNPDSYSPKWLIDYAPLHHRMMQGFINQSLGFRGVLVWAVDYIGTGIDSNSKEIAGSRDPWINPDYHNNKDTHYPGEGLIVYPGAPAGCRGVVPSTRLKWIRKGVEDYEYIELLKRRGKGAWALQLARTVGSSFNAWSQNPAEVEAVRRKMGEALDAHKKTKIR